MENIELKQGGFKLPDYVFYLAENLWLSRSPSPTIHCKLSLTPSTQAELTQSAVKIGEKLQKIEPHLQIKPPPPEVGTNLEDDKFKDIIRALKHHINLGDVFQIVCPIDVFLDATSPNTNSNLSSTKTPTIRALYVLYAR